MKITRISTYAVHIPLKPEYRMVSALGRHEISRYVIVRIETDAGIDGLGEATVMSRWSGETVWGAQAIIDNVFAPVLIDADPTDLETVDRLMDAVAQDNWFAKSAIEMACWDIVGKDAGKPIYELLDGAIRDLSICCRFSMGAYSAERASERAVELVDRGFTTIKVKVGTGIEDDIKRVKSVRNAVGTDIDIVIDANCGYDDASQAIAAIEGMADCNVALFEQPTPRNDYQALADVRKAISCPVMADDICFDLGHAKECIRNEACDVISVYPGKNGGIRKSRQIIHAAEQASVACSIGSNLELDIASAAMCHLVVGSHNMQIEDYPGDIMGPDYHEVRVVQDPLMISGPTITITDRPGLGIEADWGIIEKHSL